MTHFTPAIDALLRSKPKNAKDRKARRRALDILYTAEHREKHQPTSRKAKKTRVTTSKSSGGSFASFLFQSGKGAVEGRLERRRAIKEAEVRITQQKENAGYHHIDPKKTHKQALLEVDRGISFIPESNTERLHRIELERKRQEHDPTLRPRPQQSQFGGSSSTTITGKQKGVTSNAL